MGRRTFSWNGQPFQEVVPHAHVGLLEHAGALGLQDPHQGLLGRVKVGEAGPPAGAALLARAREVNGVAPAAVPGVGLELRAAGAEPFALGVAAATAAVDPATGRTLIHVRLLGGIVHLHRGSVGVGTGRARAQEREARSPHCHHPCRPWTYEPLTCLGVASASPGIGTPVSADDHRQP